jgi:hypothetical protein
MDRRKACVSASVLLISSEKISEPPFQKRHDSAQEEQPHTPAWSPKAAARAFTHRASVEAVVNEMLQVLAHAHLPHKTIFVSIHARQLANVSKDVLQTIGQLKGINITKAILNVRVHNDLGETKNFTAQVEGVTKTALLALLGGQRLDGLQVEIVIQMKVIQILAVNEKIEHVVSLTTHLQASFNPVNLCGLEELRVSENLEKILLVQGAGRTVVQTIQHARQQP